MSSLAPGRSNKFAGPAVILLAAAIATAPQMMHGNSCGHDFDFHLISWFDALNSWRHGIPYPHWAPSANFGAGEPRFVFYPPLTWMLGAAMGLVLPWHIVPIAVTFLLLAATGLATRMLAQQTLSDGPASLAGCTALLSGYALFTAYERSAFGELSGGFWVPLLLLLILRERNPPGPIKSNSVWRQAFDGSAAPLALVVAGAWLSNAPLGVMCSYLLAAVALAVALISRSWAPVLRATAAAALGLGLSGLYLVPAAWEQRWVDIRQATADAGNLIENSWLFARHADPELLSHNAVLFKVSVIAVIMAAVTLGGLLLSWLRGSLPGKLRWWIPLALIPLAILFLQFPISLPVWSALPKLRFLQFPWRWLVALSAPMGVFFASAVWPGRLARRWSRVAVVSVCAALFLAASVRAGHLFFQACDDEDAVAGMLDVYRSGAGFAGDDEYAPVGADNSLVATGLPAACLTADPLAVLGKGEADNTPAWFAGQGSCQATFPWVRTQPEHLLLAATVAHSGYLILRLRSYPAWQVRVNGRLVQSLPRRDDGLIAVPVPQGSLELTADWSSTGDVIAGRWLSLLAVLALTGLWLLERKLNRPRLS